MKYEDTKIPEVSVGSRTHTHMVLRARGVATPTAEADLQDLYSMTEKALQTEVLGTASSTYTMKTNAELGQTNS